MRSGASRCLATAAARFEGKMVARVDSSSGSARTVLHDMASFRSLHKMTTAATHMIDNVE